MAMKTLLKSTIVRKQIVALTGLALSGFVLMHMSGNCLMFFGPAVYNEYSHKLITNPLIYVAEVGLVAMFLIHIVLAVGLTLENRKARPVAPGAIPSAHEKRARFGSKSMVLTGILVFVFLVLHLITFKFGTY